jgi:hypothetical protein
MKLLPDQSGKKRGTHCKPVVEQENLFLCSFQSMIDGTMEVNLEAPAFSDIFGIVSCVR